MKLTLLVAWMLYAGRPAEIKFETHIPGEPPTSQIVPVVYEN